MKNSAPSSLRAVCLAQSPLLLALILMGCSSEAGTSPNGNGGSSNGNGGQSSAQGGSSNGGSTNGGSSNGGSSNGGSSNGGSSNGGSTNGGSSNGGSSNGGSSNGGSTNGGSVSGGSTNGGSSNGGSTNGGSVSGGSTNGGSTSGGAASGGRVNSGGSTSGGTTSGGTGSGGARGGTTGSGGTSGGAASGGMGSGGARGGTTGSGGAGSGGTSGGSGSGGAGTGGTTGSGVFPQCRFHFGTIDSKAIAGGTALISQLDFFTPGWMTNTVWDHGPVCDEIKSGGALQTPVPIVVGYVAAGYVKRNSGLCDCNVTTCGTNNDLCHKGAQYISENITGIVNAYKTYSAGYAACYGTSRPIVFEMEPDFYQYLGSTQSTPWSGATAASIMNQLVAALKTSLPNARFSIDASPWVGIANGTGNGADNGAWWYSNFNMSLFTFVNTSGGGTSAGTALIRSANKMTWAGLSQVTGKPILADTGYGANGSSAGHDSAWDSASNINSRMADGVVSIAQYNPNSGWASTITSVRSQLNTPKFCP
ncbi:MAG: hypothetical protein QM756_05825 [Polyangiaceae bacterium]